MFPLLTSPGPDLTRIAVLLQSSNRRVRPRLVWRNGTPLASRVAQGVSGPSSSCVWNPINFGLPTQNLKEKEYNIGNNEFFLDILDIKFSLKNKNCLLLLSK